MSSMQFVKAEPTPEQQRLIDVGGALLRQLEPDAALDFSLIPADDAVLVYQTVRGGGSVFVAADESVLFAASAISPDVALDAFRAGKRTAKEKFVRTEARRR